MAGQGPAPKERHSRDRDDHVLRELEVSEGVLYGEPLPDDVLPKGEAWHPQTIRWWDAMRSFPLLEHEPEIGWQFLLDTALMHHTMWTRGKWEFASELRLRVAKYGATPEDRMRLKIKVKTPGDAPSAPATAAGVTSIRSRRGRLSDGA